MSDTMNDEKDMTSDEKIAEIKGLVKKAFGYIQLQQKVIKELTGRIEALEAQPKTNSKPRTIRAKPEAIAFAAYLLDKEDFTLQEVSDSGVLSYNRAYGLSQWPDEHLQEFLESKGVTELYEQGTEHKDFAKYVPDYTEKELD